VSNKIGQYIIVIMVCFFIFVITMGCGSKDEKAMSVAKPVMAPSPVANAEPIASSSAIPYSSSTIAPNASTNADHSAAARTDVPSGIAVEVDGVKLTKGQIDAEMKQKLAELKDRIPTQSLEQAKTEIRKGLIDEFVVRTLLFKEIGKKKVTADEKEIAEILGAMKAQLPTGVTMEDLLKKNKIDSVKMHDEIALNIRINKLVLQELGGKIKISDKESTDFYNKNQDKFKQPESVHARHLLVAIAPGDTDMIKTEKKKKAEELRKQLATGADFADLAAKNSDCPSKQNGGDLGFFSRGQMVKTFEDAAFSQEKNAIGPVVETDFGFHIIQVLEHKSAQVTKLDGETRKQITAFLERQKQEEAFSGLVKRLKADANIVVYGK
jgi:peptidyl-prolyl cis-trans isomerase C